jgi:hypothetical protein
MSHVPVAFDGTSTNFEEFDVNFKGYMERASASTKWGILGAFITAPEYLRIPLTFTGIVICIT